MAVVTYYKCDGCEACVPSDEERQKKKWVRVQGMVSLGGIIIFDTGEYSHKDYCSTQCFLRVVEAKMAKGKK